MKYNWALTLILSLLVSCSSTLAQESNIMEVLDPQAYQKKLSESQNYYLIDVRTSIEYNRNRIEGAENISYIGFSFKKKAARLDTTKAVFIYCETAHRSPNAAKKLKALGFDEIYDLQNGFRNWRKQGLPVEK